jgi:predicted Zn-dependent peptidase
MERLLYRSKASFFVDCSSPDYASYAMVAPSSSFDEAWPAFAGSVLDPALREDDFEAVKIARLRDLASIERSTAGLALSALRPAAFSGHPYAASPREAPRRLQASRWTK